jgi:acyl-CoA synthetase (AMP-forming)/AMP-acid ligase II
MKHRGPITFEPEVSHVFRSSFPHVEDLGFRTATWLVARAGDELRPLHPTLLHALAHAAKLEDRIGITLLPDDEKHAERRLSWRGLYLEARALAAVLEARGARRGDRVLVVLPTSLEFAIAFFALLRLGAIPCPSYPPAALEKADIGLERLRHVARHAGATLCITSRELHPLLGDLAHGLPAMHDVVDIEELLGATPATPRRSEARPETPAFIQYTSGSTSHPKGVLLGHGNLVANIHAIGQAVKINRRDVVVSWLPLYHDMGLIGALLFAIYWRLPLVLMSPMAFLLKPARWLQAIHRFKGTLSASPNFGYARCVRHVRAAQRQGLDLSSWRVALNGAEPVNVKTLLEFEESFAPHGFSPAAMLPVYGLAEASLAVTFPRVGDPSRHVAVDRAALAAGYVVPASAERPSARLVCVGEPVPGHDVRVVDSAGLAVDPGEVGHIVVKGPSVMMGYFADEKATRAVLQDGWLWTGDLGFFEDGGLYVTGRAKDLIIIGGKNHYAEDVERVAEHVDGVRPGGAAAFGVYDEESARDVLVVVCESWIDDEARAAALVEAVSQRVCDECRVTPDEVVLVPPGTIPKTSSGKRQRSLCRQRYLEDQLVPQRTSKLRLAQIFIRSQAGHARMLARRVLRRRREPD